MPLTPAIEIDARPGQPLGMPPARFLRDYWQKHPLLVRGAFAGRRCPLTPEDLAGLSCEELSLSRLVAHEPAADRWSVRTGPFDDADFAALPPTHWTLLVQDVDKWDADVAALLGDFAFLPSWRVDDVMVSYAVDGGSVGAHVDQYDVFLIQGMGRRRWRIDTDPAAPTAFRDDVELKLLRSFAPTHDWLLEPGDLLYLPPGVPHHGIAEGACLTLSVGMRAPSVGELVTDLADTIGERLPEDLRYTDPDLAPARRAGEIDDDAIARLHEALTPLRELDEAGLRDWFGRFITRYRSTHLPIPPDRPLDETRLRRELDAGATLSRNPWSRMAWQARGRTAATLYAAGEPFACPARLATRLCAGEPIGAGEWNATELDALCRLVNAGHLALVRPSRRRSRA